MHLSDIRSTQPKNPSQTGHRAHALLHRQKEQGTTHLPSTVRLYLTAEFTVENSDPSLRILARGWNITNCPEFIILVKPSW